MMRILNLIMSSKKLKGRNTKHRCVRIIQKMDTAHILKSASLHMEFSNYVGSDRIKRKTIELVNVNHFGKTMYAGMV